MLKTVYIAKRKQLKHLSQNPTNIVEKDLPFSLTVTFGQEKSSSLIKKKRVASAHSFTERRQQLSMTLDTVWNQRVINEIELVYSQFECLHLVHAAPDHRSFLPRPISVSLACIPL